jgi:predicted anti-sigma-YlaC factor YlaD
MTCGREDAWLSAYLDGEALDGGTARAMDPDGHLESCADCRGLLADLREVRDLVRPPRVEPDPFFLTRFRARREAATRLERESWRRVAVRLLLPATAAAAVMAVVTVGLGERERDSFWDLERHALGAGSPRVQSAPAASDLEPFLAAALGPREPVRPRVAGEPARP